MNGEFESFTTDRGVELIRRWHYGTKDEWDLFYALARDSGLSVRQLLLNLALDHKDSLRQDLRKRLRDLN